MGYKKKKRASKTDEVIWRLIRIRVEKEQQVEEEYLSTLTELERQAYYRKKWAERKQIIRDLVADKIKEDK